MTRNTDTTDDKEESESQSTAPDQVAIEGQLPLTAIDIESQKDITGGRGHSLRYLHKWFAARPTPAARLAILGSAYPGDIDSDELLKLMQVGPKSLDENIAEYVEEKFNENKSGRDSVDEHYGYPNPNTQTPTQTEIDKLHNKIKEGWGGELPTVLDPTSGRGIIPFEAVRYGFPTIANELNPVPALITKVALEYAPEIKSITPEINKWRDKIHKTAKDNIKEYYPTVDAGNQILNSAFTYIIGCNSCGGEIPLVDKWWLSKNHDSVIIPQYENGEVAFEHSKIQDAPDNFNPKGGPVSNADAECPHCGVITDSDEIRSRLHDNKFDYRVYGVNYETQDGERHYRAGGKVDRDGMRKSVERVESDFDMMDFLSEPIPSGAETNRLNERGIEQWRDMFTPRQLITHYELLQAFNEYKQDILETHSQEKAELILTILTFGASRLLQDQTRSVPWSYDRGYGNDMFTDNNYALKKTAGDNNLVAPRKGYNHTLDRIVDTYEEVASQCNKQNSSKAICGDAGNLSDNLEHDDDVDIAVVDPPYYSSIMYAELSDVFYVLQKQYLDDIHPELFDKKLTNKEDEAVANPSKFDNHPSDTSKKELADQYYENKMKGIFNEIHESLSDNGVMTVMFTHREMDAWDTLTSALIDSNFIITATHPVKTERKDRIGMRGSDSADSSIFITARKQANVESEKSKTLWNDIENRIHTVAKNEAEEIINSDYNISKTDTAIAAYGPTLEEFVREYPVVNKNGEELRPREALSEARQAVTSVLVEEYLNVNSIETIDSLTRWYILLWLIYENDTVLLDEARQIGMAADIDINDIKSETKIWGKSSGDLQLKGPDYRVQDIVRLENENAENPSTNAYPINPTKKTFQHVIDAIHSAIHVYDREGSDRALQWLKERNMDTETEFHVAIIALLETIPSGNDLYETLKKLVQGQTGEYLDIDLNTFVPTADPQTKATEWLEETDE